jgi:predicted esterase
VPPAPLTLVLLHGREQDPASMRELAARLGIEGAEVRTPAAPGLSWYDGRYFQPRAELEPSLDAAIAQVHGLLDELEAGGTPPARTLLGGFSQGACLACDAIAVRPRPLGGLAVLCGALVGTERDRPRPAPGTLAGLPVLLAGTEEDEWVDPVDVRTAAQALRAAGADVELRIHPPAPHEVHDDEVDALRALAQRVAAGGGG